MCSSGDSRRAEADATDRDALPGFHSWGAEAASLCLQGSPAAPLCGEERCAGSFWTNGVRGDASGNERRFSYRHQHVKGRGLLHLGHQRHGADDIVSGERFNLIMWNKSSSYRTTRHFMSKYNQVRARARAAPPSDRPTSRQHGTSRRHRVHLLGLCPEHWLPSCSRPCVATGARHSRAARPRLPLVYARPRLRRA